jgi:hypothetical protein
MTTKQAAQASSQPSSRQRRIAERIERFIKAYHGIDHHVAGQG